MHRREFLALPALAAAKAAAKSRIGFVRSDHTKLAKPSSIEDPLDYVRIRDMVWKTIEYGKPQAGSLAAKVRPGSWVVIKPNIGHLRSQPGYAPGDVTDFRVTRAVVEYVARKTRARRITVAEGGGYRRIGDPETNMAVEHGGMRVDATNFDWGPDEFPGFHGSLGAMLAQFAASFPRVRFDYVDLSYDAVRGASGAPLRLKTPTSPGGAGAFGARSDYFIAGAFQNCDFLIDVPVMKVHSQCGVTACLKNLVGAAPRTAYAPPGAFHSEKLHSEHSYAGRIDPFIADLAAFHPPDYNIVDGIRGLQYQERNAGRPGQTLRNNFVLAGEDAVAIDAVVARLMGFNPHDIDYLHMAEARGLGTLDISRLDVTGDDLDRAVRRWGKPRDWHGRANREWRVALDSGRLRPLWRRVTARSDTLNLAEPAGPAGSGEGYAAAVRVHAGGYTKAVLWVGVAGRVSATLNGQAVMSEENAARCRTGEFRKPVELLSGENLLEFRVRPVAGAAQLTVSLTSPRNDGDTVEGIRWSA